MLDNGDDRFFEGVVAFRGLVSAKTMAAFPAFWRQNASAAISITGFAPAAIEAKSALVSGRSFAM